MASANNAGAQGRLASTARLDRLLQQAMCGSAHASVAPVKHLGEQAPPCEPRCCGVCAACAARAPAGCERAALLTGRDPGAAWLRAYAAPAGGRQARRRSYFELLLHESVARSRAAGFGCAGARLLLRFSSATRLVARIVRSQK